MPQPQPDNFEPPTPEQVRDYLQQNEPQGPNRWTGLLPFIALGVVMGMAFTSHHALAALLPIAVVVGLLAILSWRVRSLKRIEQRAVRVQELTLTRSFPQALRLAWRVLPDLRALPELHGRTVAAIAHCLDQVKAFDAAIVSYDYLIVHLPNDHPGAVQLTIQRSIAQLFADQLADADDALRRLRNMIERYRDSAIGASYRLAYLVQQVFTGHYADAIEESDNLIDDLRPLGVEAGYGYALMALSHHKLDGKDTNLWWERATLLVEPASLVERFDQLDPLRMLAPTQRPQPLQAP
jgi:tetratricopeptide (TPR) repeat protein